MIGTQACKTCFNEYFLCEEHFDTYIKRQIFFYDECIRCREERLLKDRERRAKYREENFELCVYREYVASAKKRGIECHLTQNEVTDLIFKECFYCGRAPDKEQYERSGIDRLDSFKHYTLDNVVSACTRCNMSKQSLSVDEFFTMCIEIVKRHNLLETLPTS